MAHEVRIGYRFPNGDIEGYVGEGDTQDAAERDAYAQLRIKLDRLNEEIVTAQVIRNRSQVTQEEYDILLGDWASGARQEEDDYHGPNNRSLCDIERLYYQDGEPVA